MARILASMGRSTPSERSIPSFPLHHAYNSPSTSRPLKPLDPNTFSDPGQSSRSFDTSPPPDRKARFQRVASTPVQLVRKLKKEEEGGVRTQYGLFEDDDDEREKEIDTGSVKTRRSQGKVEKKDDFRKGRTPSLQSWTTSEDAQMSKHVNAFFAIPSSTRSTIKAFSKDTVQAGFSSRTPTAVFGRFYKMQREAKERGAGTRWKASEKVGAEQKQQRPCGRSWNPLSDEDSELSELSEEEEVASRPPSKRLKGSDFGESGSAGTSTLSRGMKRLTSRDGSTASSSKPNGSSGDRSLLSFSQKPKLSLSTLNASAHLDPSPKQQQQRSLLPPIRTISPSFGPACNIPTNFLPLLPPPLKLSGANRIPVASVPRRRPPPPSSAQQPLLQLPSLILNPKNPTPSVFTRPSPTLSHQQHQSESEMLVSGLDENARGLYPDRFGPSLPPFAILIQTLHAQVAAAQAPAAAEMPSLSRHQQQQRWESGDGKCREGKVGRAGYEQGSEQARK